RDPELRPVHVFHRVPVRLQVPERRPMKITRPRCTRAFVNAAPAMLLGLVPLPALAQQPSLDELLARTSRQVSAFVDEFSSVKCTERVTQEKLGKEAKVERRADSTFDYLVILTNTGGELSLDESRLAI